MDINKEEEYSLSPFERLTNKLASITEDEPTFTPAVVKTIAQRCIDVGIEREEEIEVATKLCNHFGTALPSIINWVSEGLTLPHIERALLIKHELDDAYPGITIIALHRVLEHLAPSSFSSPSGAFRSTITGLRFVYHGGLSQSCNAILETLIEASDSELYPLQRVLIGIDERFGGDIYAAYNLCVEDPEMFRRVLARRVSAADARIIMNPYAFYTDGRSEESILEETLDGSGTEGDVLLHDDNEED